MATGYQMWQLLSLSIVCTCVPGVLCDNDYNIGGLVAAAAVSFILLAVVIAMIAAGLTWNNWYPQLQWAKGRVRMPRAYWKKREEAKRRLLLHGSRSGLASLAAPSESGLPNGHGSSRVRDTASWVQGWNNANTMDEGGYEEMALAMDLGEEREEPEIRIETTVVDNEAFDLHPYHSTSAPTTSASAAASAASTATNASLSAAASATEADASATFEPSARLEMTEEEPGEGYIYSVVDRSAKMSAAATRSGAEETADVEGPAATSEKVTSFSKVDPYLVAL